MNNTINNYIGFKTKKDISSWILLKEEIEPFFMGIANKYKPIKCKLYVSHNVSSDLSLRALDVIFESIKENHLSFLRQLSNSVPLEYSYNCHHENADEVGGAINQLSTIHFWMETINEAYWIPLFSYTGASRNGIFAVLNKDFVSRLYY